MCQILCSSTSHTLFHLIFKQSYQKQKEKLKAQRVKKLVETHRACRWQGWNLNPGPANSKACAFSALQASCKSQPQKQ